MHIDYDVYSPQIFKSQSLWGFSTAIDSTNTKTQSMKTTTLLFILTLLTPNISQSQSEVTAPNSDVEVDKSDANDNVKGSSEETTKIDFVGSGNLQNAYASGDAIEANTGLGVIFKRNWTQKRLLQSIDFDLSINVASTADSIVSIIDDNVIVNSRDFGEYLLLPRNSRLAFSFNSRFQFGDVPWLGLMAFPTLISGVNIDIIRSNSIWKIADESVNLNGSLYRVGIFHDFMPDDIRTDRRFSITAGASYSWRQIDGDISFDSKEDLRNRILKASDTVFEGFEFNVSVRLNNLRAEIMIPNIQGNKNGNIDGLTGTQFFTSITFVGGFPLAIDKEERVKTP